MRCGALLNNPSKVGCQSCRSSASWFVGRPWRRAHRAPCNVHFICNNCARTAAFCWHK